MTNNVKAILALAILVVLAGGAYLAFGSTKNNSPATAQKTTSQATQSNNSPAQTPAPATATIAGTISYDGSSFSPSTLSVKVGDTIKVSNQSSASLVFDSDPHPVHTDEPELNIGAVDPGQSQTFKVTKAGSWGYHNHLNSSQKGTLVVQ